MISQQAQDLKDHLMHAMKGYEGTMIHLCYSDWRVWCVRLAFFDELITFHSMKPSMQTKFLKKIKDFFKFVYSTWDDDTENEFAKGNYHRGKQALCALELFKMLSASEVKKIKSTTYCNRRWLQFLKALGVKYYGNF